MVGDNLAVFLFLVGLAASFSIAGIGQARLTHRAWTIALFGLSALFGVMAATWPQIKEIWPSASLQISNVANNPISWFVLLMIVLLAASANYWRSTHPIPSINITRLEKLEREQTEIKADLRAALTFELDIATFFVLDDLVNDTPKFNDLHLMPGRDGESLFEEATKFIRRVSTSFEGSSRGMEISSILSNASIRAEQHLRTIPPDQRPSNVDPIDLAKYKTVEFQCLILVIFLVAQKVEKKDQMISHRGNIADRVRRLSQV